jgi:succinoglycan biosynthesis protein ExoM
MPDPTPIDVLICTYQRASLDDCLASVFAQKLPDEVIINVIVADNAPTKSAQKCVFEHGKSSNISVKYVHAPAGNISIARNACLDQATGDFVAFLDDDETAPTDWLALLWQGMVGSDVAFGPVLARYPSNAPTWITGNDFHTTTLSPTGVINTGYAGNVMMRWRDMPWATQRFDLALGTTGGEDTDFFNRLYHLGAKLSFNPHAIVHEPVTNSRLKLRWLAMRRYRSGQSFADTAMLDMHRVALVTTALFKSLYSAVCTLIFALSAKRAGFWLMRSLFHFGVFTRGIWPRRKGAE